jgi:ankyrin repeat protein
MERLNNDSRTPLHIAANNDHVEVVRELQKKGGSMESVIKDG